MLQQSIKVSLIAVGVEQLRFIYLLLTRCCPLPILPATRRHTPVTLGTPILQEMLFSFYFKGTRSILIKIRATCSYRNIWHSLVLAAKDALKAANDAFGGLIRNIHSLDTRDPIRSPG